MIQVDYIKELSTRELSAFLQERIDVLKSAAKKGVKNAEAAEKAFFTAYKQRGHWWNISRRKREREEVQSYEGLQSQAQVVQNWLRKCTTVSRSIRSFSDPQQGALVRLWATELLDDIEDSMEELRAFGDDGLNLEDIEIVRGLLLLFNREQTKLESTA